MASLAARAALYFKFCVTARFKLTPAPLSAKEVAFLHESFSKLGTLEFFHVQKPKHLAPHLYGQAVTVVLNASHQFSQLDPFSGIDNTIKPSVETLSQAQNHLTHTLLSLCGIPRFSYLENDRLYFSGEVQVPFKHSLVANAVYLANNYKMSTSTIQSPFVMFEQTSAHKIGEVMPRIRHNFQKYHKMEPVFVETGAHGVHLAGGGALPSIVVDPHYKVDTEDIMQMAKSPALTEKKREVFDGFMD